MWPWRIACDDESSSYGNVGGRFRDEEILDLDAGLHHAKSRTLIEMAAAWLVRDHAVVIVLGVSTVGGCIEQHPKWADSGDDTGLDEFAGAESTHGTTTDSTDTSTDLGETDTNTDGTATDPEPVDCASLWAQGGWTLESPTELTQINSPAFEYDPRFSGDGLTMFFGSDRTSPTDIYQATRPALDMPFGAPSEIGWVSSSDHDFAYAESADGLVAVFVSNRPGGAGASDLWMATRDDPSEPFGSLRSMSELNTPSEEWDAFLSPDALRLYWTTGSEPGENLYWSWRHSRSDSFTGRVALDVDDPNAYEDSPVLTNDERVILFGSNRSGGFGDHDLWIATRADRNDAFGTPTLIPVVNTPSREGEIGLSPDGCELYFGSNRQGGTGSWDLYVTRIVAD